MRKILSSFVLIILLSLPSFAGDVIVAKVNGSALTQKNLDNELDRLIPQITFHRNVPPEKRKYYYGRALEELIAKELMYQDAVAREMTPEEAKVDAQIKKFTKRFRTEESFKAALDKEGLTEDRLRATVAKEMAVQTAFTKTVSEPSQVGEEELKQYYEKNLAKFKQPETMRLRIMTISEEKKARDVYDKLKEGDDFGELAYNMSEDEYRVKSGDVGYVHKGRMLSEVEAEALKLKTGEISAPFKADDKWYLVKMEDKKPERQMSLREVHRKLKNQLEKERAAELKKKWLDGLKAKSKIEIFLKTE